MKAECAAACRAPGASPSTHRARRAGRAGGLGMGAILGALCLPKCPLCLAAYLTAAGSLALEASGWLAGAVLVVAIIFTIRGLTCRRPNASRRRFAARDAALPVSAGVSERTSARPRTSPRWPIL